MSMLLVLLASTLAYSSPADDGLSTNLPGDQQTTKNSQAVTTVNWSLDVESVVRLNTSADRARYLDALRRQGQILVF